MIHFLVLACIDILQRIASVAHTILIKLAFSEISLNEENKK